MSALSATPPATPAATPLATKPATHPAVAQATSPFNGTPSTSIGIMVATRIACRAYKQCRDQMADIDLTTVSSSPHVKLVVNASITETRWIQAGRSGARLGTTKRRVLLSDYISQFEQLSALANSNDVGLRLFANYVIAFTGCIILLSSSFQELKQFDGVRHKFNLAEKDTLKLLKIRATLSADWIALTHKV